MEFEVVTNRNYIFVSVVGNIAEAGLLKLAVVIQTHCEKAKLVHALIDFENAEGGLSVSELYSIGIEFFALLDDDIVVSYINPPSSWNVEVDALSRSLAQMRGHQLYLFSNLDEFERLFA